VLCQATPGHRPWVRNIPTPFFCTNFVSPWGNFGSPEPLLVRPLRLHGVQLVQPLLMPKPRCRALVLSHRSSCRPRCAGCPSSWRVLLAGVVFGPPKILLRCLPVSVPFSRPRLCHTARNVLPNLLSYPDHPSAPGNPSLPRLRRPRHRGRERHRPWPAGAIKPPRRLILAVHP
jgi:hypothetical protein